MTNSEPSGVPESSDATELEPSALEKLADRYEQNPAVHALVKLLIDLSGPFSIPVGTLEQALLNRAEDMRQERLRTWFDALAVGNVELTEEVIKNQDFVHAFISTSRAVLNTRRKEKIQLFGRLLVNFPSIMEEHSMEDFEDMLSILDDLSYREFQVLLLLRNYERDHPLQDDENELQRATRFWDDFLAEVASRLDLSQQEIQGMLGRLNRTGLYETFTGGFMDYRGGKGSTTALFDKFIDILDLDADSLQSTVDHDV